MNKEILAKFASNPPANPSAILQVQTDLRVDLPKSYLQFMSERNGGEGFVGDNYLMLWRIEELAELNRSYEVATYAPGLILFGSNGGGEGFAFDFRGPSAEIVSVPFVGMDISLVRLVSKGFEEFLKALFES